jgi:hypothetical protein
MTKFFFSLSLSVKKCNNRKKCFYLCSVLTVRRVKINFAQTLLGFCFYTQPSEFGWAKITLPPHFLAISTISIPNFVTFRFSILRWKNRKRKGGASHEFSLLCQKCHQNVSSLFNAMVSLSWLVSLSSCQLSFWNFWLVCSKLPIL